MLNNKVRLGDLIEVLTDYHANGAYKKLKENVELLDDEDYALMVRTTNFENNDFHDSVKYISEHAYNFLEKSKVYPNDLIMNKIANAGSIYLMPDLQRPVSLAMNLFLIRVNEKLANPVYVYLYLKINEQYVKQFANGSVTKTITKEAVRNLEIFLPSREEQDIVVEHYLALDNKINLNLKINQNLESIAQAVFKSWFIDFDPVRAKITAKREGKDTELAAMCVISGKSEAELEQMAEDDFAELQATAALFPDELVGSELGEVPKGWSVSKVDDILKRIKIKKRFKKNDVNEFGQTFVLEQGSNIILGFHDNEGNISASKEEPAFIFGDHTCITRLMLSNFDVSENVIAVTGKERNSYWTYYAIKDLQKFQEYRRHWMELTSKQVVVADVRLTDYFAKKVKILHEDIEYSLRENLVLMNLRNTLLPKLLSGEIDISVMNREQI
jgi:type I restriction enzyme S subunit